MLDGPYSGRLSAVAASTIVAHRGAFDAAAMTAEAKTKSRIASHHAKELVLYNDVHHVFDFPGLDHEMPFGIVRYDRRAADDAVAKTRAFLARHLE